MDAKLEVARRAPRAPFTIGIMRSASLLLLAALPLAAQTSPKTPARPAARTAASAPRAAAAVDGCVKVPELSPKIPAMPAGVSCPKALYTISTLPSVRLDYVSPMEGPGLREELGLEGQSFTLAYVDTKVGSGAVAAPHKWYTIHYTGYLADGTKFDSSVDRNEPISIEYGQHQVIAGWDTGFDGMHVGGKRRLFIPYQLAYGANGRQPMIPPKAELIFDVELVAQSDTEPKPEPKPAAAAPGSPAASPSESSPAPQSSPSAPAETPAPATKPQ